MPDFRSRSKAIPLDANPFPDTITRLSVPFTAADPLGEIKFVETLIGKHRETHAFPGSTGRDQPAVPFNFTGQ